MTIIVRPAIKVLPDSSIRELIYTMTAKLAKDQTDLDFIKELAEELSIRTKKASYESK